MPPPFDELAQLRVLDVANIPVHYVQLAIFQLRALWSEILVVLDVVWFTITPLRGELEQDAIDGINIFRMTLAQLRGSSGSLFFFRLVLLWTSPLWTYHHLGTLDTCIEF